jgi:Icc protein
MLTFIHITDTHLHPDPNYKKHYSSFSPLAGSQAVIRAIQSLPFKADFVLHTGDVTHDLKGEDCRIVNEVFAPLDLPIYYVAGNHDDAESLQTVIMGTDALQKHPHYELEIKGVQIVCLDSNAKTTGNGARIASPAGYIPEAQIEWLEGITASTDPRPLIVAVHHNPVISGVPWLDTVMRLVNGADLHRALLPARDRLRGVFYGHTHMPMDIYRDGILYSAGASAWCQFQAYPGVEIDGILEDKGALPGFSVVTVGEHGTTIRRHTVRIALNSV